MFCHFHFIQEFEVLSAVAKHLVDSYIGVLKQLAATELVWYLVFKTLHA